MQIFPHCASVVSEKDKRTSHQERLFPLKVKNFLHVFKLVSLDVDLFSEKFECWLFVGYDRSTGKCRVNKERHFAMIKKPKCLEMMVKNERN